jgi:hypothetical protein
VEDDVLVDVDVLVEVVEVEVVDVLVVLVEVVEVEVLPPPVVLEVVDEEVAPPPVPPAPPEPFEPLEHANKAMLPTKGTAIHASFAMVRTVAASVGRRQYRPAARRVGTEGVGMRA